MIKGIDISKHNGNVNFTKVRAAGYSYVIIRAGYGKSISQKDPMFEQNYTLAKAAGLDVGAYWYSYAATIEEAKTEAECCLKAIEGKKFEYPIYFDLEEQKQLVKGRDFCTSVVDIFCSTIEKAGYWAGLYMSKSPLESLIDVPVRNKYALWIAQWGDRCTYTGNYGMWQSSEKGVVNGISGFVDLDECKVDYPSAIKSKGLNGYGKPSTVSNPAKYEVVVGEFDTLAEAEAIKRIFAGAEVRRV